MFTKKILYSLILFLSWSVLSASTLQAQSSVDEIQRIIALNPDDAALFGNAVAISGNYAIVGAHHDQRVASSLEGAAYIFERNPSTGIWNEVEKLTNSDPNVTAPFGWAVDISGDYAVVSASGWVGRDGAFFIYERNPITEDWNEVAKFTVPNPLPSLSIIGQSVAIEGNYVVVGHPGFPDRIYERDAITGLWSEIAQLITSDATLINGSYRDVTGHSVAMSGTRVILGAVQTEAAYIFELNSSSGNWEQIEKLTASDPATDDQFGGAVAIFDDYVIVGASGDDDGGSASGSAYIFELNANTGDWDQVDKITASDANSGDQFGGAVAISSNYAIVGANGDDGAGQNGGAAYVFERKCNGDWRQGSKFIGSEVTASDNFGVSVAISGNSVLVGSDFDDEPPYQNNGSAYFFEIEGSFGLPEPWVNADVANPDAIGQACHDEVNDAFTVKGSGDNIGNSGDEFHFMYQSLTCGDATVIAKIKSIQSGLTDAKAGVMIRKNEAFDDKSQMVTTLIKGDNVPVFIQRSDLDGGTNNQQKTAITALPYYVRIVKSGNTYTGSISSDGITWDDFTQTTVNMGDDILIGLAVSSGSDGNLCEVDFEEVSVECCGPISPWLTEAVESTDGEACLDNGVYTVSVKGDNIGNSGDKFRFMYQNVNNANSSITAKVTSIQSSLSNAKVGVMIRKNEAFDDKSQMASALIKSDDVPVYITRATAGSFTVNEQKASITLPYYVRVTKTGNNYVGAISSDGITWSDFTQQTINMGDDVLLGLAVSSGSNSNLCEATFEDIAITSGSSLVTNSGFGSANLLEVVNVYPNELIDSKITTVLSKPVGGKVNFQVHNLMGELQGQGEVRLKEPKSSFHLDFKSFDIDLPKGIYIVTFQGESFKSQFRLVK